MSEEQLLKLIEELSDGILQHVTPEYRYKKLHVTYHVGEEDAEDRATRFSIIEVVDTLFFFDLTFGVTEGSLICNSIEDLEMEFYCLPESLICLPLKSENPRMLAARFFFLPRVKSSECREINIDYRWPGMWKPLRERGKDRGEFHIMYLVEDFEIRIVLSQRFRELSFTNFQGKGINLEEQFDNLNRKILVCKGKNVENQVIRYSFES
jgi:hypothetical protein